MSAHPGDGTISIVDLATGATLATAPASSKLSYDYAPAGAGPHDLKATFAGSATYTSAAAQTQIWVLPNTLDATGVGSTPSTFYPHKDGYRDTATIKGLRQEPISVDIKVYGPTGKVVFKKAVAAASGGYSVTWNGRTSSGTILAAGKYRVEQVLTDAWSAKRTVTSSLNLSQKGLVLHTVTLSKTIGQTLRRTSSWAVWKFTLPSAAVYKSIKGGVYASSTSSAYGGSFGLQDFTDCGATSYSRGCVGRSGDVLRSKRWYWVTSVASVSHSGRTALLYVWAGPIGKLYVWAGKLRVTYGVLK